jgi:anhydro-N-acetylmuramic acid kinase
LAVSRLSEIASKEERLLVGLSSGTSADGVDAALVKMSGSAEKPRVEIIHSETYPYPEDIKRAVLDSSEGKGGSPDICRLNYQLGSIFAESCLALVKGSCLVLDDIDAVGSHGQTVCHLPPSTSRAVGAVPCTLQLGEPAVIAEKTKAVVVSDFRSADIAAGGEGAPLAPCLDYVLFGGEPESRGFLNVGGIANLSVLPSNSRWDQVMGFDTGPGNMLIDYLSQAFYAADCDRDGELSRKGRPSQDLIEELLRHDFFTKVPPKSAGREIFGAQYAEEMIRLSRGEGMSKEDILATVTMLTARSVHRAYTDFSAGTCKITELNVSGGGAKNKTLMSFLEEVFSPIPVYSTERLGIPTGSKEALLFAVLAGQAIAGVPSSLPQVTGAAHRVVLGKIIA